MVIYVDAGRRVEDADFSNESQGSYKYIDNKIYVFKHTHIYIYNACACDCEYTLVVLLENVLPILVENNLY